MDQKDRIDLFGAVALTSFSALLAFNQVVIKVTNGGLQPVFFAGLRSAGAVVCLLLWLRFRGLPVWTGDAAARRFAVLAGILFAAEFLALFIALDLTSIGRSAVIFYSMPVWMALMAHVWGTGDRITGRKGAGLAIATSGVALAFADRRGEAASLLGDLAALVAAVAWAATGILAKASPLRRMRPESQLLWQVAISAPILLLLAPLFGPLVRDLQPIHLIGLGFQIVVVVSAGFVFWLWLLSIYPASGVASFSFLSPVFAVGLGWALLGEPLRPTLLAALALVALGLWFINRPAGPILRSRRTSV